MECPVEGTYAYIYMYIYYIYTCTHPKYHPRACLLELVECPVEGTYVCIHVYVHMYIQMLYTYISIYITSGVSFKGVPPGVSGMPSLRDRVYGIGCSKGLRLHLGVRGMYCFIA